MLSWRGDLGVALGTSLTEEAADLRAGVGGREMRRLRRAVHRGEGPASEAEAAAMLVIVRDEWRVAVVAERKAVPRRAMIAILLGFAVLGWVLDVVVIVASVCAALAVFLTGFEARSCRAAPRRAATARQAAAMLDPQRSIPDSAWRLHEPSQRAWAFSWLIAVLCVAAIVTVLAVLFGAAVIPGAIGGAVGAIFSASTFGRGRTRRDAAAARHTSIPGASAAPGGYRPAP